MNKKRIFLVLIAFLIIGAIFGTAKRREKEIQVNIIESPGFKTIGVKNKILKTPAAEKIEKGEYTSFYTSPTKATCAVEIESQRVVKEDSGYNWYIKAKKVDKEVSFEINNTFKNLCLSDPECVCNKELLNTSNICSFNPKDLESRVYLQAYFVNLDNRKDCSFEIDKVPAEIKNNNNQEAYYLNIPQNTAESEEYKIKLPISSNSVNSGCLLASLDIIKVNNLVTDMCSVEGPQKDFVLSSNIQTNTSPQDNSSQTNKTFYSAEALKKTNTDYDLNCYIENEIDINKVGIEVYKNNSLLDTKICTTNQCSKENVLDSASSKEFIKYTIPYTFNDNGNYKIKCISKN